eukprot:Blabericola_migrator_1__7129@NODE_360_length_9432_cov_135_447517_g288_i0_p3_GENE_NODE_360_length_9432_cov_135_447517_g288_i0NODE_360_length_9432_cov_135_447517_g288_i0_p3_ORF_typecomplete_len334_score55_26TFIIB/PF00382_19/9_4e07TFIIB/PF00382_19/0_0015TF_Zn_Ribbon/PF08271_12/7_5e13Cyclin_C/PF02984_19/6_7e02Cyclin_C/PF02984_19/56Cyclin_C/PF02984_19/0_36zfRING_4/PF14570_6/19zfRING_4/PF14570_6/1_8DUF2614/PF11023_8/0_092DZR/PF12773_7/1_9DZR/PF12773_7/0_2DZR/PF12773_7/7_7e03zfribbon_3/PF13248_6/20zfri
MRPGLVTGAAGTIQRLNIFASTKRSKECPNCRDQGVIVYDNHSGDDLCSNCGQVLESRVMSEEQEWRTFSNTDGGSGNDKSRVGGVNDTWMEEGVQGTTMMGGDKRFNRLAQAHELATSASSSDRQLKTAFNNLRLIAEHMGLRENILERCKEMVKDLQVSGNLKSRTGATYMLSIVYLACREEGMTMTLKEVTSFDRTIQEKELAKAINRLKKFLPQRPTGPTTYASAELIPRFCAMLQLGGPLIAIAEQIAKKTEQTPNKHFKPNVLAGAAIYLSAQLHAVQNIHPSDIATAAKCGFQLMMACYKELSPIARSLVPANFVPMNVGGFKGLK